MFKELQVVGLKALIFTALTYLDLFYILNLFNTLRTGDADLRS